MTTTQTQQQQTQLTPHTLNELDRILELPGLHIRDMLRLQEQIEYKTEQMISVSIRMNPYNVKNENHVTMEDRIIEKAALEERWHRSREKYERSCREIWNMMTNAGISERDKKIMYFRWCQCHSVPETAEEFGLQERQIYRISGAAKRAIVEYWNTRKGE